MCGRFVTGSDQLSWREWATMLELGSESVSAMPLGAIRIPADDVEIVRRSPDRAQLELVSARWGLAPSWMKTPLKGAPQFNVRSETAPSKFKKYYAQRRCVLPAGGFWIRRSPESKQRVFVRGRDQPVLALAGLWTEREYEGATLRSCTLLTREANSELGRFHERMPIVLDPEHARRWLDPSTERAALDELCTHELALELEA